MAPTILQRRVACVPRAGGPEVIEIAVEDMAPLQPNEVRVRVEAAALNHAESLIRSGTYVVKIPFPYQAGGEGAGTVVDAGPGAEALLRTRVCWGAVPGSCATHLTAPASMLVPIPDELSTEQAACLPVAALTAGGLARVWPLKSGSAVVWAAAGAVGRMLVAILAAQGVEVIGIASGSRVASVKAAGAAHAIDRAAGDVAGAVRALTGGRGVSAVFDPIGAPTLETSLQMLAPRGCLINFGELGGVPPSLDLHRLFRGSLFVTKYNGMRWVEGLQEFPALVADGLQRAVKNPAVVSEIAARYPLDLAVDAYRELDAGAPGKLLLIP